MQRRIDICEERKISSSVKLRDIVINYINFNDGLPDIEAEKSFDYRSKTLKMNHCLSPTYFNLLKAFKIASNRRAIRHFQTCELQGRMSINAHALKIECRKNTSAYSNINKN